MHCHNGKFGHNPGPVAENLATQKRVSFFLYGRKAGTPLVALSLLASCIGGTATLAMVSLGASAGWPASWWLGSGAIGLTVLGLCYATRIRATKATTLPEAIGLWQGYECRLLAGIISLLASIGVVAAQFNALGIILSSFLKLDFTKNVILGAVATCLYTCFGGQGAVMKSDIWQFIILAMGLVLALAGFLTDPLCRDAFTSTPLHLTAPGLPFSRVIYFILIFGGSFIIGPMIFGRILSAKDQKTAKGGALWAALGLGIMSVIITAIGVAISGLGIDAASPEYLFSIAAQMVLPDWLSFFVVLGLLCAIISSADSCLLGAATIWSNDIHLNASLKETRYALIAITTVSIFLVFRGKGILALLMSASDIFSCGIVGPTMILLAGARSIKRPFFLVAIICGGLCGLIAAITGMREWSLAGLAISCAICLTGRYIGARE